MEQNNDKVVYDYADKFINLANELAKTDNSGNVGMALRFAAARFSVFESSTQTNNLAGDKDKYMQLIADNFNKVLAINFDDYIKILSAD
jgi:hypothetical protein